MLQRADSLIFNTVAERLTDGTHVRSLGEIATTGYGFYVSPEDRLYRTTRTELSSGPPIAPQPSIKDVTNSMSALVSSEPADRMPALSVLQQTRFVNLLVQFADRSALRGAMQTPGSQVEALYDEAVDVAASKGPLDFSQQLELALNHTDHLPSAVWNLLMTNRQFARWRDTAVIDGLKVQDRETNVERMLTWERSIAAVKQPDRQGYQDTSGDAYYVWTHALARIIYTALPDHPGLINKAYAQAFRNGSNIMSLSSSFGKISPIATASNHTLAGNYGNAIGDVIANRIITGASR